MARFRVCACVLTLGIAATASTGCSNILHDLQPHRLHRLNQQAPPAHRNDVLPYFSIPDPATPHVDATSIEQPAEADSNR